ncbi:histidinol-phosphate transaminase [Lysinibacter sp. HNR]|uniref:histidinol-phosphate transaminase n=1 Tax=Lysinibacter sp. HNR TaxID=3031408 RepID=UPI002435039E|nr:histidinol-phosphate transaminase [Lysinibacter sp. HNR]WGD37901.1 histidinol-phosphate transaminase [Lysinibacter sp. HNR]
MATLDDLPLRPDLVGKKPYGAPQDAASINLNVNENPHPIPEEVAADIVSSLATEVTRANRYPDRDFGELRESLARYLGHGLTVDNLWAANGSNEILQQVLQAFGGPGRSLLSFVPTYSMYPLLASGTGTEWIPVPRGTDFSLSAEDAVAAVRAHTPDITIICTPNNPTGTPMPLDTIRALYDVTNGIVVVDEAYAEFGSEAYESALTLLPGRDRLLVSRTMSKAFAFAGVRIGYLAGNPAAIDAMHLVRLPYHLSALTQAAGIAALRHSTTMLAAVGAMRDERVRIARALSDMGYTVHPSEGNFVLFGGVSNPQATFEALRGQGILIRDVGIPGHLRVSVGTHSETSLFLEKIAQLPR